MDSLTERLHKIQSQYFPRWDINHKYRIEQWYQPGARCNYKEKIIKVSDIDNEAVIIHEICHAVVRKGGHGAEFQNRLLKAADMADNYGNPELAKKIRDDVEWMKEVFKRLPEMKMDAKYIQDTISDYVIDRPDVSFEQIVKYVAQENGLYPEELLKYWPKSTRKAFDGAHHQLEITKAVQQKYDKLREQGRQ
jgi:hypothetical protein